jgi:hypothetical protein
MSNPINVCWYIGILALASCTRVTPKPEDKQLGERIIAVVKSTGANQLNMDTVVKGEWDYLYILHPYTSDEQISSLRKEINDLSSINLRLVMRTEGHSHLIFTRKGEIVTHTTIFRYPCCDFIASDNTPISLKRREAVFRIERSFAGKDSVYKLSVAK